MSKEEGIEGEDGDYRTRKDRWIPYYLARWQILRQLATT
jgi:hypothetical protein